VCFWVDIVKQAKLHMTNYSFLVFLLATDVIGLILENWMKFIAILIYLADMDVAIDCIFLKHPNLLVI